jgi:hypothetical protein
MRASILLLALLSGCGVLSRDPDPNVRMSGAMSEADRRHQDASRAAAVQAEPGHAWDSPPENKFGNWQVSPHFDFPPPDAPAQVLHPDAQRLRQQFNGRQAGALDLVE